jgi:hypothetical protein
MQTKTCKTCNETKPLGEFGVQPTGKYGVKAHCKTCYNAKFSQSAEYRWMHRYGLTPEAYQNLFNNQGGRCATCGVSPEKFYVDHDHACCAGMKSCGECVRGLLCFNCNTALGQVKDNPRILLAMVDYLAGVGE